MNLAQTREPTLKSTMASQDIDVLVDDGEFWKDEQEPKKL